MTRKVILIKRLLLKISREKCAIEICKKSNLDYHDTTKFLTAISFQCQLLRNVMRSATLNNIDSKEWIYTVRFNDYVIPMGERIRNYEEFNNRELFKYYRLFAELKEEIKTAKYKKCDYLHGQPLKQIDHTNTLDITACERVIINRGYNAESVIKGRAKKIKSTKGD